MEETKTIVVDMDTVTMVLDGAERTRETSRPAIDEIARRVEAELARRGVDGVEVRREYRLTGAIKNDNVDFHAVLQAVLVGQVDEIRAAVLGA